jgi:Reverse transcriptase (RNA-dependent DNA polymerase)
LERVQQYLDRGCGFLRNQSAYCKGHSTETALLKIVNDLLVAADHGEVSARCRLDLSAAFDTVDHELLLSRQQSRFGVVGTALNWFRSYLNRSYTVMRGSNLSAVVQLVCSVAKGSILGPLLFLLYSAELEDVVASKVVSIHIYDNDTQLYVHCKSSGMIDVVARLEQCIDRVDKWLAASLNSDKSEVIWVGVLRTQQKYPGPEVPVGPSVI